MKVATIGDATLYLGDSLEILPTLAGMGADMVFADPPYGMKKAGIINDNLNYDDLLEFNKKWILPSIDALKDGGSWYCWGIEEPLMDIYSEIIKPRKKTREITYRNFITWDKGSGRGQLSATHRSYVRSCESCLFVTKGNRTIKRMNTKSDFVDELKGARVILIRELKKAKINAGTAEKILGRRYTYGHWISAASWRMIVEQDYNAIKAYCKDNKISAFNKTYKEFRSVYESALQEWRQNRTYFDNTFENMNCVWRMNPVLFGAKEYCGHPAQKPVALCTRAVKASCPPGGVVLDPFMGSGSAGVACVQSGRRYIGIDINKESFDIARKRIWDAMRQGKLDLTTNKEGG